MRRHLDLVRPLLREPCPIDPSTLPRVDGGLACAACGRTVIDVARLTLDEAVEFRRRAHPGGERVCGAYTLDRDDRVLLKAAPNSTALVAVAIGVLLAACDGANVDGKARAHAAAPPTSATERTAVTPPSALAAVTSTPIAPTDLPPRAAAASRARLATTSSSCRARDRAAGLSGFLRWARSPASKPLLSSSRP